MRILITGGAGFIGSHLCDYFLARGDEVIALDNFITGSADNIAQLQNHPRFRFIRQDVTDYLRAEGYLDAVLHFASPASPVSYIAYPIQTLKVGALGTHKACGLARAKGARFLLASTSEVYGDPLVHPQPEDYWGNVNPIGPRGVYDEAKRFAEAMTLAYHRAHDLNVRIARIFIGQALRGEPLTVHGDGSQTRSFCYVSDLIEGIARLLDSDETTPVNIGNPNEMTILTFAQKINALTGNRAGIIFRPRPVDDPSRRCPDISKARRVLGWEPKVSLDEGLEKTIAYFAERIKAK